jgi:hypothetical protein
VTSKQRLRSSDASGAPSTVRARWRDAGARFRFQRGSRAARLAASRASVRQCSKRCGTAALLGCILAATAILPATDAAAQARPAPSTTSADGAASPPSGWTFRYIPFLWMPEVQGKIATRGLTAKVDIDFDKLLELMGNGELFAAGGHFDAGYDRFWLFVDAFGGTARPKSDVTFAPRPTLTGTADVTLNFTFVEFGPAYRVLDWPQGGEGPPITLDVLTGGRFMYFYQSLDLQRTGGTFRGTANATSTWVDPFVGGRFAVPLIGDLDCVFRGDIGGFGAGSQLAWNVIGGFQYALPWEPFGARTSVVAVYKALDFDHQSGSGRQQIVTKLDLRGPAFGLGFAF